MTGDEQVFSKIVNLKVEIQMEVYLTLQAGIGSKMLIDRL